MQVLRHRAFEPTLESVGHARRFLSSVLPTADERSELGEVAALLTSELVSNAVLHARTTFDVCVEVVDDVGAVEISVIDHSPALPVVREPDLESPGGRGMYLVDQLSAAWGVDRLDDGKRVWCRLGSPPMPTRRSSNRPGRERVGAASRPSQRGRSA